MAMQTRGSIPGKPGRPTNVEYDPSALGANFKEAAARGGGIVPGGSPDKKLIEAAQGGFGNPLKQISDWWNSPADTSNVSQAGFNPLEAIKNAAHARSKPVRPSTSSMPKIDTEAVNKAFGRK